jgi:hypothetical protein
MKLYMFPAIRLPIIRSLSLFTIHSALVYVVQVCGQLSILVLLECTVNKPLIMCRETAQNM